MDEEKIRALMKEDYEEITQLQWSERYDDSDIRINYGLDGRELIHFKEKESFPIVFDDDSRRIEVDSDGVIKIMNTYNQQEIIIADSLPQLYKAIEKSKELRSKNG